MLPFYYGPVIQGMRDGALDAVSNFIGIDRQLTDNVKIIDYDFVDID
jgi:hypothetical protein